MTSIPIAAIGALGAAIVAGVVSTAALIVGKENKTSEFRQAWIDELRTDVAEVIARAIVLDGLLTTNPGNRFEIWQAAREDTAALLLSSSKIIMRLNPTESESRLVLSILGELIDFFGLGSINNATLTVIPARGAVQNKAFQLQNAANDVLKAEWRRVKRGEPRYWITTAVAALVIAIALAMTVWSFFPTSTAHGHSHPGKPSQRPPRHISRHQGSK